LPREYAPSKCDDEQSLFIQGQIAKAVFCREPGIGGRKALYEPHGTVVARGLQIEDGNLVHQASGDAPLCRP
jgi:hypothetical protein